MSLLDNERVASYSKLDQRLVVTALNDASVLESFDNLDCIENLTNSPITKRPCIIRKT